MGRPLFGIFPTPSAADFDEILRLVKLADELGLDLVGVQDHPYQRRFLDTFSLLPVLLAETERIVAFPDVANLPLRGAAMLAKAAASIDVMFPGRFVLGIGAGGFLEAVAAMGGPQFTPGQAVDAFEEAIPVIRALWSGQRGLRVPGVHHHLAGVHSGPVPTTELEIWTGAGGPRMLELTGRLCDGWVPSSAYLPPERLTESMRAIDRAAREAGRSPSDIRRIYNVAGTIRPGPAEGLLVGDGDHWQRQLVSLSEQGIDGFLLVLGDDAETQVRRFAEVADAVRAVVT